MSKRLMELREQRQKAVHDARQINEKVLAEKRDMTSEEETRFNAFMADQEKLGKQIKDEERLLEAERETRGEEQRGNKTESAGAPAGKVDRRATKEYAEAFGALLRGGAKSLTGDQQRALQADIDTDGGFIVAPQEFVKKLIKTVDDLVYVRQYATVLPVTTSTSIGAPSLDSDPADGDWTAEILTGSEDSSMKFGGRELHPYPLAKRIKVSKRLLRTSALPIEELVAQRLAYKFAIPQEKAFLLGDGNNKPLGVFQASTAGIPAARDITTDNTATAFTMDGLINAKYALKAGYQKNAKWMFHRDGVRLAAKLKDSTNQYLWQPSNIVGEPDTLLGVPVLMSEYVPNTFTTGQYVGIIGDFSYYWIADALDFSIQVLNELYAETNQIGYIARMESDGMPVLGEAFARVKLA